MDNGISVLTKEIPKWNKAKRIVASTEEKIQLVIKKIISDAKFEIKEVEVDHAHMSRNPIKITIKEMLIPEEFSIIKDTGYYRECSNTYVREIHVNLKEAPGIKLKMKFIGTFEQPIGLISEEQKGIKCNYGFRNTFSRVGATVDVTITYLEDYLYKQKEQYKFCWSELISLLPVGEHCLAEMNNSSKTQYNSNSDIKAFREAGKLPEFDKLINSIGMVEFDGGDIDVTLQERKVEKENVDIMCKTSDGTTKNIGVVINVPVENSLITIKYKPKGISQSVTIGVYPYKKVSLDIDLDTSYKSAKVYYEDNGSYKEWEEDIESQIVLLG